MTKSILSIFMTALLLVPGLTVRTSTAAELITVHTAWLGDHETFPMWYAKERGWDKEMGLHVAMRLYDSGADMLTALASRKWQFALMGAVPAMLGNLRYNSSVIAIGNDEAACNGVLLRADSDMAQIRGWNGSCPDVYGSPQTVRGKTFLVTAVSSAHYALNTWLEALGLRDSDITIRNMDQEEAMKAFARGEGDGMALWAPHMFLAMEQGAVLAADMRMCRRGNPIVMVADSRYAVRNPDVTVRFLAVYLRGIAAIRQTSAEELLPEYQRFYRQFSRRNYSDALALQDLKKHPVFLLEEQLALFSESSGPSQAQQWQAGVAAFFSALGRITPEEARKVGSGSYATGKYLRLLAQQPFAPLTAAPETPQTP